MALLAASSLVAVADARIGGDVLEVVTALGRRLQEATSEVQCSGSHTAGCDCILSCPVFNANKTRCNSGEDQNLVVSDVITQSLRDADKEKRCRGITCVVECAKRLNCLDDRVIQRCMLVKTTSSSCQVNCNGAVGKSLVVAVLCLIG